MELYIYKSQTRQGNVFVYISHFGNIVTPHCFCTFWELVTNHDHPHTISTLYHWEKHWKCLNTEININVIMTKYEFIQIKKSIVFFHPSISWLLSDATTTKNSSPTENSFSQSSRLFPEEKRNDSINLTVLFGVMMLEKVWRTER